VGEFQISFLAFNGGEVILNWPRALVLSELMGRDAVLISLSLRGAERIFSFLRNGLVERILMGVFFWGWQLVRSYSPKYSSLRRVYPKDAGMCRS
jgi:hypothetical protein